MTEVPPVGDMPDQLEQRRRQLFDQIFEYFKDDSELKRRVKNELDSQSNQSRPSQPRLSVLDRIGSYGVRVFTAIGVIEKIPDIIKFLKPLFILLRGYLPGIFKVAIGHTTLGALLTVAIGAVAMFLALMAIGLAIIWLLSSLTKRSTLLNSNRLRKWVIAILSLFMFAYAIAAAVLILGVASF